MSGHEHSKDNFAYKEKTKVGPKEKVTVSRFVMINLEKNNGNIIPMEKEVSHGGIAGGVIEENNKVIIINQDMEVQRAHAYEEVSPHQMMQEGSSSIFHQPRPPNLIVDAQHGNQCVEMSSPGTMVPLEGT